MQIEPRVFPASIQWYLGYVFHSHAICNLCHTGFQFSSGSSGPDKLRSLPPDCRLRDIRDNVGSIVIYAPKQVARGGHKFIFIGRCARTRHRGLACKYRYFYEDNRFAFNNGGKGKTLQVATHFARC